MVARIKARAVSVGLVSQALRQRLGDQTEKLVLIAFAEHAGADGLSFPSVDLIAAEAQCSGRTVQRVIKRFVEIGLLQLCRRASGRGYPTTYRVCPDAIGRVPEYDELRRAQRAGSHPAPDPSDRSLEDHPQADIFDAVLSTKGDTQASPLSDSAEPRKGDRSGEKGDRSALKGDTQTSPEPRTSNHKERAGARPVDNSRADGARDSTDHRHPSRQPGQSSGPSHTQKRQHPGHYSPTQYRLSLQEIEDKARKHAIQPRKKWESECAFRNRINVSVASLCTLTNDCHRLKIETRRPDESCDEFERRVTRADMQQRGLASSLSSKDARKQALAKVKQL